MVEAVISIDVYHFLAPSDLTSHLEDTGIGVFLVSMQGPNLETKKASQKNPTVARKIEQNKN